MEQKKQNNDGLINPEFLKNEERSGIKKISYNKDGLMERDKSKTVIEDGRELLKED